MFISNKKLEELEDRIRKLELDAKYDNAIFLPNGHRVRLGFLFDKVMAHLGLEIVYSPERTTLEKKNG